MNCPLCQGWGFSGGYVSGPKAGPWRWCSCAAAAEKIHSDPELVEQANQARDILLKVDAKKAGRWIPSPGGEARFKQMMGIIEPYHGEF